MVKKQLMADQKQEEKRILQKDQILKRQQENADLADQDNEDDVPVIEQDSGNNMEAAMASLLRATEGERREERRQMRKWVIDAVQTATKVEGHMEQHGGRRKHAVTVILPASTSSLLVSDSGSIDRLSKLVENLSTRLGKIEATLGQHGGRSYRGKPKSIPRTLTCYNCRRTGHLARECVRPDSRPRWNGSRPGPRQ